MIDTLDQIFNKYSKWIDIQVIEHAGNFYLIQMKIRVNDNKKIFRKKKIAFVNNQNYEGIVRANILEHNI